jgi:hypothetical protein
MNMRRFALLVLFVLAGCMTTHPNTVADPDFALMQLTQMPDAASHVMGNFPVQYRLQIGNRAAVPLTLKMVNITSVGMGAYDVPSQTRPFDVLIAPSRDAVVDFYVSVNVTDPTIIGANGPVTLHGVVTFDSEIGQFQKTFMLQANEMATSR